MPTNLDERSEYDLKNLADEGTRNAHMVHVVDLIRFKNGVYILVEVSIWIPNVFRSM